MIPKNFSLKQKTMDVKMAAKPVTCIIWILSCALEYLITWQSLVNALLEVRDEKYCSFHVGQE